MIFTKLSLQFYQRVKLIHNQTYSLRPGGVYGQSGPPLRPGYGQGGPFPEENRPGPGILTGPVPSWVRDGPYKEFDQCKCTEKFNCPSPGISYVRFGNKYGSNSSSRPLLSSLKNYTYSLFQGHCDIGKQYCCYSRKPGGPLPSRPVHSPENGVLVGPGGPIDPIPGINAGLNGNRPYPRPGGFIGGSGYQRPGAGGFGFGGRPTGFIGRPDGFIGRPQGFIGRPGKILFNYFNLQQFKLFLQVKTTIRLKMVFWQDLVDLQTYIQASLIKVSVRDQRQKRKTSFNEWTVIKQCIEFEQILF